MSFHAGWSEIDITPPLGLRMGGRGLYGPVGDKVLDPLMAQATVLQDAVGTRLVFVSLDAIGLTVADSTVMRRDIAAHMDTRPECVILNCSHTHSGPDTHHATYSTDDPEPENLAAYRHELHGKLVALVAEAAKRLHPVRAALHRGESEIGINRRMRVGNNVRMGPNPQGAYVRDL